MKKLILAGLTALTLSLGLWVTGASLAQQMDAVPTLAPPTPIPTLDNGVSDALLAESTLARVQRSGEVRVGMLYNAPPFGELNIRGEVIGYDADLARALAEAWDVTFVPVQVTRQTAVSMLQNGEVDVLAAALVHRRELDSQVEFSQTYYIGAQAMLVRNEDTAQQPADLAGRRVGVVLGTSSELAVAEWQRRSGLSAMVLTYYNLGQAVTALAAGEVDAVVDSRVHLQSQSASIASGLVRLLETPITAEPYALAVRRQDVNWLNLINWTLQYLETQGKLKEIYQTYFPGGSYPSVIIPWNGVGEDAPTLSQFQADVPYPAQYVIPRMRQAGVLRVAGLVDLPPDAPESERRLDALNRALIQVMASRWGVQVQAVPGDDPVGLVASGQADIAASVVLDWAFSDRVDLTAPYLLHGERLMVKENDDYETFNDIRGKWVGVFASEPGAADRVNALAASVNTAVRIFTINREQDAAFNILVDNNADMAFGDSLKLIPNLEANPGLLRITTRAGNADPWYSRTYVAFAVPRNDIDFRLLVDYTLQELAREGAWQNLLTPVMLPQDVFSFDIWPGASEYLGFILAG
ncbi:MAG: transporter substrate-binding domain-containing protein [Anaerolineaceae bacterium]|nr:transporter substrate-binding domain-containing protein [Anaerolineaceae bacterium]